MAQAKQLSLSVATAGPIGQSFAVKQVHWKCKSCGTENKPTRVKCHQCWAARPAQSVGMDWNDALKRELTGGSCDWREVIDPNTHHLYYWNTKTGETSWSRPEEMGPAPHATGWLGRGEAGSNVQAELKKKKEEYLRRPARVQIEYDPSKYRTENKDEYNIYWDRWIKDSWRDRVSRDPADTRCDPEKDAGFTKADSSSEHSYFCIMFARGCCHRGPNCTYLHRIPLLEDDARIDTLHDCFGRSRHASHRDDMGGVGSFQDDSRTLYVGGLKRYQGQDLDEMVRRHFEVWGEIENINIIHRLSCAFVRYRLRSNAEFGKVAMSNQSLDNDEVLNIRWAYSDPNPVAKEAIERANQDAIIGMLQARGVSMAAAEFHYPSSYQPPEDLTVRGPDGTVLAGPGAGSGAAAAYPNTDTQYGETKEVEGEAGDAQASSEALESANDIAAVVNDAYSKATADPYASGVQPTRFQSVAPSHPPPQFQQSEAPQASSSSVYGYSGLPSQADVSANQAPAVVPPSGPPPGWKEELSAPGAVTAPKAKLPTVEETEAAAREAQKASGTESNSGVQKVIAQISASKAKQSTRKSKGQGDEEQTSSSKRQRVSRKRSESSSSSD